MGRVVDVFVVLVVDECHQKLLQRTEFLFYPIGEQLYDVQALN